MTEITYIHDLETGRLLIEAPDRLPKEVLAVVHELIGPGEVVGCARPLHVLPPPEASEAELGRGPCVRISGYYHNSLIEGPGRRSSVLFSGCNLGCNGCWVPYLHPSESGSLLPVDLLAAALLDPAYNRDGVSILGGEPFQQPDGLLALVRALRARGCAHILCYSGYTYEALLRRSRFQPAIGAVLDEIDVLVDGPYVEALAHRGGPWTGSGNQRVIDLGATRLAGHIVYLSEP
jgi:anaerobic ribonucleoside-triphosphate reductase activating protein